MRFLIRLSLVLLTFVLIPFRGCSGLRSERFKFDVVRQGAVMISPVVSIKLAVDCLTMSVFAWAKYPRRMHAAFQEGYMYWDGWPVCSHEVGSCIGLWLKYTIIDIWLFLAIVSFQLELEEMVLVQYVHDGSCSWVLKLTSLWRRELIPKLFCR